jgi:hypothetical protein
MDQTKNNLSEFKTPKIFYPFIGIIVILVIVLFCMLFKVPNPFSSSITKTANQGLYTPIYIVLFIVLLLIICFTLLPNFKEVTALFLQINNVTYTVIYTIFLVLFFTLMPKDIINNYAYIIFPITALLSVLFFYMSFKKNLVEEFNFSYERIKVLILFFCLITSLIVYYNIDPGGYISKYFGFSLLLTIIITVFAFLYLVIVLTLPEKVVEPIKGTKSSNFLSYFTNISSYGSILFFLFIAIVTIAISTYPGGFFNDKTTSAASICIILIICIFWTLILGTIQFPEISNNAKITDRFNLFKRSLLAIFGIIISSLIIFWIVYTIQHFTAGSSSSITSLVLNVLLVVVILGLIYKTIFVQLPVGNSNKNGFFSLLTNLVFYIPCLIGNIFDNIGSLMTGQYGATNAGSILMLIVTVILIVLYFKLPNLLNKFFIQGGKQLINEPVNTIGLRSLGTYQELNGSENYDYQYSISFWFYLDANPPNTNPSYNKYTSLLNYGNKPNVLYCGKTNTLMVTIEQKDLEKTTRNKLTDFDENGNRILYINDKVLLQKWNNMIINYSGGILDIFLNNELVKSDIGVVPYYTIDNLTIGENEGLNGSICNVVYFRHPLNTTNMYILYNMVKDKTPPILSSSSATILKQNVDTTFTSAEQVNANSNIPDITNM